MQPTNGNLMNDVHIKEKKPLTPCFMEEAMSIDS